MRRSVQELQPHPMWLFEENYLMLRKLFAEFEPGTWRLSSAAGGHPLTVDIEHCGPYTSSVMLRMPFGADKRVLRPLTFEVRIYMDARLAEASAYQECRHIPPAYAASAVQGFVRDERRQVNHLLHDVLRYCLDRGYAVSYLADAV